MIIKLSKAPPSTLDRVANFVLESRQYISEIFPQCKNKDELTKALRDSDERLSVLVTDRPLALFLITQTETDGLVERFCPENTNSLDSIFTALQEDLKKRKVDQLIINVPNEQVDAFVKRGLEKKNTLLGLSGKVVETKLMAMLPLSNPRRDDIPKLGKLMYDSYEKGGEMKISSVASAESSVRNIIDGSHGTFLPDASYVSSASGKIVSASLITSDLSGSATIAQLFTHPLYRARGLATTEIAMGMNRLLKRNVSTLSVWVGESDLVARRLFGKLGFMEGRRLIQMHLRIH